MDDSSDIQQTVKLNLEKQERNHDEKLDIMFQVMMNEMQELKEKLWFTDRKLNKFAEKYVSNWKDLLNFRKFESSSGMQLTKSMNPPPTSYEVDITGLTKQFTYGQQQQYEFKKEALEPIIIYFKYPVEFSAVEFSVNMRQNESLDLKVFVYGVMKPNGIIRKKGLLMTTSPTTSMSEESFIMPSLSLLKEQEFQGTKFSVAFQSPQPYDGIGIAVRYKKMFAENGNIHMRYQYSDYQLSNIKIF